MRKDRHNHQDMMQKGVVIRINYGLLTVDKLDILVTYIIGYMGDHR